MKTLLVNGYLALGLPPDTPPEPVAPVAKKKRPTKPGRPARHTQEEVLEVMKNFPGCSEAELRKILGYPDYTRIWFLRGMVSAGLLETAKYESTYNKSRKVTRYWVK